MGTGRSMLAWMGMYPWGVGMACESHGGSWGGAKNMHREPGGAGCGRSAMWGRVEVSHVLGGTQWAGHVGCDGWGTTAGCMGCNGQGMWDVMGET